MRKVATPGSLTEALRKFSDAEVAHAFVVQMRWPEGVACPHCGMLGEATFMPSVRRWQCKDCRKQFSVKVGTILEGSPIGLDTWLCAMWMIANCKNRISSYQIHRTLGITQKTACFMHHRIRLAQQSGWVQKLGCAVEAPDENIGENTQAVSLVKRYTKICDTARPPTRYGLGAYQGDATPSFLFRETGKTVHAACWPNVNQGSRRQAEVSRGYRVSEYKNVEGFVGYILASVGSGVHSDAPEKPFSLRGPSVEEAHVINTTSRLYCNCYLQSVQSNHRKDHDGWFEMARAVIARTSLTYRLFAGKEKGGSS